MKVKYVKYSFVMDLMQCLTCSAVMIRKVLTVLSTIEPNCQFWNFPLKSDTTEWRRLDADEMKETLKCRQFSWVLGAPPQYNGEIKLSRIFFWLKLLTFWNLHPSLVGLLLPGEISSPGRYSSNFSSIFTTTWTTGL